ncbi:two-component regulator propeller domain-containing protein [Flavobacterium sp. J27]|uniref:ligand-binding sensor domain-containing protein n=1 Tax=Flavobacterium sp. J27 TaxID=2060419 RepID=UPI0010316FA2|nr:two-component regulator propeller domain-containing protein [Flavobacterium sp. J27]
MKKIFLFVLFLTFLLQSCNGQHKNEALSKEISTEPTQKENGITPNTSPSFSFMDNSPISQVVRTLFQDSRGNLWFGTENGAFLLRNNVLLSITDIQSRSGKGVTIKAITETKDGTIWLGHTNGISSVKGETVTNYYESDGLLSNDVWCITADREGKIWIGTIAGICVFDGKKFTNFELPEGIKDTTVGISSTKMIHKIIEDYEGKIWIASNAGLFSYANNQFVHESKRLGITTPFVNTLFEDSKKNLWVSTKVGLYCLKEGVAKLITHEKIEIRKGIGSIAEDKDGLIWIVVNQHFLYTYDGNELKEFQQKVEQKRPVPFEIYKDQKERLWLVGFGGASRLENGEFIDVTKNGPW